MRKKNKKIIGKTQDEKNLDLKFLCIIINNVLNSFFKLMGQNAGNLSIVPIILVKYENGMKALLDMVKKQLKKRIIQFHNGLG